jgi:hypothetical protein
VEFRYDIVFVSTMLKTISVMLFVSAFAPAANLTGTWSVKGDIGSYPIDLTCQFTQKDTALSGVCKGNGRPDRNVTGHAGEKAVDFAYDIDFNGEKLHVSYRGTVDENGAMKGSVEAMGTGGQFTATKQK